MPEGAGTQGLQPLGVAGQAARFTMVPAARNAPAGGKAPTSVTLFDQGLAQVLEAAVTGLEPKHLYVLALSDRADGGGKLEPLASFMTWSVGAMLAS